MDDERTSSFSPGLDIINREAGFGGFSTGMFTLFNGHTKQAGLPPFPVNTDDQGYIFFTRPELNLTYDNIINIRHMLPMTDRDPNSMNNAIRCMLMHPKIDLEPNRSRSKVFDDRQAFMTVLSNTCTQFSGWSDMSIDSYVSDEGYKKSQISMADGPIDILNTSDLTATFHNPEGNPVLDTFLYWLHWISLVSTNEQVAPFLDNLINNRLDYQSRVFRFTMDRSRTYIKKFASCIVYPTAVPIGSVFNLTDEARHTQEQNLITVPFRVSGGIEYNDPIILSEFNKVVYETNPEMADDDQLDPATGLPTDDARLATMVKLDSNEIQLYGDKAYPRIGDNMELEWWVTKDIYKAIDTLSQKALGGDLTATIETSKFNGFRATRNKVV